MKVLIYPHSMELGGSQLNAIELASALQDRGHEVCIYSDRGPLLARVHELGLKHLARRPSRYRPGVRTARDLRRIIRQRGIDVVHGFEWPTAFEADAATAGTGAVAIGTIMSMSVAPFLPRSIPLVVGTAAIQASATDEGRVGVYLIEPPVDITMNSSTVRTDIPEALGLDPAAQYVVIVSRLVTELKLEGILTAIDAVDVVAEQRRVQLVIVGDGSARAEIESRADAVNARHGREVVVVAGEFTDPRWAYAMADICVGMGGSALRAAAFGKPLIVQGERGFFKLLDAQSVHLFLSQGWYGVGSAGGPGARSTLVELICHLLDAPEERARLGEFARRLVVDRFSLEAAAAKQEQIYRAELARPRGTVSQLAGTLVASAGLVAYKARRRWDAARGESSADDFNARPVIDGAGRQHGQQARRT